ncbi:BSD domain-containing protein 1 [Punica granatum]|uniref:BSD domain-containing protein n=2 Tax=Punica granatum TaxID=22663 RepID=A0A218WZX6_PUNGR|nr:BSD domain-containing protein 1 [Punica granatum]OWM77930.1 hypothetical protein CDL15_Pgr018499 [Punica granatum]PKI75028.1 hypothetical protein CRG98_004575 [Punica granatum]
MNFFKSVFSDEPEPINSESSFPKPEPHSTDKQDQGRDPPQHQTPLSSNPNPSSGWDFGGLIKTLTSKSESVIETYRRDLEEFGSGLKKEIEVAHGSLGTVGQAIDELGSSVLKGTAEIIAQGKDVILSADRRFEDSPRGSAMGQDGDQTYQRYSRFDAQVRAIQGDAGTYCDEPEDLDDYKKWKLGFDLGEKREEIRVLSEENDVVKSLYEKVVSDTVDDNTFWCRYFYRIHKLEQAESFRASLVRRAISSEEEELSWDVYDDDDDDEGEKVEGVNVVKPKNGDSEKIEHENSNVKEVSSEADRGDDVSKRNLAGKERIHNEAIKEGTAAGELQESRGSSDDEKGEDVTKVETGEKSASGRDTPLESGHVEKESETDKSDSKPEHSTNVISDANTKPEKSSKDHETAQGMSQPSALEEEDLGWDEIEDLSSIDDQKASHGGNPSPNRAELTKRLSAAEDEEDLSWDIEDDDGPAKA